MADSYSHKLGQFIGDTLEIAVEPHLAKFANEHQLFLDKHGMRLCRNSKKVSWKDNNGNSHDLDFVLERNGSDKIQGEPVAFIEIAWRRYTKHSRAKAQEIQGAVEPLFEKYRNLSPFKGAILAGVFTPGALKQLASLGFKIVYVDYQAIVKAFMEEGLDISFEEGTSEKALKLKVKKCRALSDASRGAVGKRMLEPFAEKLEEFFHGLRQAVERKVVRISIVALFGEAIEVVSIAKAIAAVNDFDEKLRGARFNRYEISVEFSNGDSIKGQFQSKLDAISFLKKAQG